MVDTEQDRLEAPAADPEPGDGDDVAPMWGVAEATENIYVRAGPSPADEYVCSIAYGEYFKFTRVWGTPDHTYYELRDGRGWSEDDVVVISSPRIGVQPPEVSQAFATADYKGGWIQLGPRVCDIAWDPNDEPPEGWEDHDAGWPQQVPREDDIAWDPDEELQEEPPLDPGSFSQPP